MIPAALGRYLQNNHKTRVCSEVGDRGGVGWAVGGTESASLGEEKRYIHS